MTSGCPRRRRPWPCRLSTKDWDASLSIIQTDYSIHITQRSSHAVNQKWRNFPMPRMVKNRDKRMRPIDYLEFCTARSYCTLPICQQPGKLDHIIDGPFYVSLIFHSKANFAAYQHLVCPSIVCTCLSLFEMPYGPIVTRKTELSIQIQNNLDLYNRLPSLEAQTKKKKKKKTVCIPLFL